MAEESKIDYNKLGFKSGLEVHQQLDADGRKLFCKCPNVLRKDEPDYIVERKLHAVAGETGEIDIAAKHEAEKEKNFFYECYHENVCLVDLDEEPPREINEEALKIALQISLLLNAKIIPITQIMRKTVIDGSNTSGFQRTAMIARDGWVDTSYGRAIIQGIFLEEDSARPTKKEAKRTYYRLDRLGIPLVEITTDASMKNPEQVREVALHIGNVLRSCKVKRGIGTIRQDVNFSIKKGKRTELKGFQEPKMMTKVLDNEINRQLSLIEKGKEIDSEVRNVLPDGTTEYMRPMPGGARMYPETDLPLLKMSRAYIDDIRKNLPKLRTEIGEELKEKGLHEEMIKLLFKENKLEEFRELLEILDKPQLIVKLLIIFPKEIASHEKLSLSKVNELLNRDVLADVLHALDKEKISESNIKNILERIVQGESFEQAISKREAKENIEEKILKLIKSKPGLSANAYMGLVMSELKGQINGKEAMEIIRKHAK
ncbi:MAG TPA: Glu-tRNA(Gln) amidotransferase subunit GatE [Patescibacteria group bacterium]|nr:Glu-tRNA(Gln) amidotransferase subunit GatE [Patescibacteria group bacterium]